MDKYTTYVGMDVHARSITARAMAEETGESFSRRFTGCPSAEEVAEWLSSLPQPVYCAYESGCTGTHLARDLRALGFDCDVIAVSTLARSSKDKKSKCDKHDAKVILREILNPMASYSTVWIPDAQTEADRSLARAYRDAVDGCKRAKQKLESFLLLNGFVWNEKTPRGTLKKTFTREWWDWVGGISFENDSANEALGYYVRRVKDAEAEVKEMKETVGRAARDERNAAYVDALCQLKGLSLTSAFAARVEFGDFSRFASGRKVSCWAGVVPSNNSSGQREAHGRITKAGNSNLRRTLVEGASTISAWSGAKKRNGALASVSAAVEAMAADANARLYGRYEHLTRDNHLHHNKAKVAVVNELVRWVWAIGRQVQLEQERQAAS
ncbi:MAG: IS110 family transposase [Clostridia bacterium]|nr:IS110 family transposase [Clostridia bacterium]